jgi:hypothetical protein
MFQNLKGALINKKQAHLTAMLISAKEFITLALCHFYFYAAKLSVLTT